jgi:hypothetical protein
VITVVVATIPPRQVQLARALASVKGQTFPPTGLVVAVDHQREGAAATRNRALKRVDTPWVAFLDDDEMYPDHLKLLARYARLTGADVVYPGYDCDGDDPVGMFPVTVLARTSKVRDAGGFQPCPDDNGDPCEDWGLWLAMHGNGAKFAHLPVKTWRWHNADESTRGRPDRW